MPAPRLRNIKFDRVTVRILSLDRIPRIEISWALAPTSQSLASLFFFIDRGESPVDMHEIAGPLRANTYPSYLDQTGKLLDLEKTYYYRVRAVEMVGSTPLQTFTSEPMTWEGRPDLVSLYIIEEHLFAHRYVFGMPALIFKKMKEGIRCPECWDNVLKRVTKSNCHTCKGTGWQDGYYEHQEAWMDFNPDPKQVQIMDFGAKQPSQTDIQFTNFPLLNVGDIIVELSSTRYWRCSNVRNTEKNRTTILQVARLDEINRSDIEVTTLTVPDDVRKRMLDEVEQRERISEFG